MMIKTRVKYLRNALENTVFFRGELYDDDLNPAERLYITTEKPASEMSIEELTQLIEDKREQAIVRKALAQYYEAIDILRTFGAEIESDVIGLDKLEWLKDKGE
jgi:hypothetical protein